MRLLPYYFALIILLIIPQTLYSESPVKIEKSDGIYRQWGDTGELNYHAAIYLFYNGESNSTDDSSHDIFEMDGAAKTGIRIIHLDEFKSMGDMPIDGYSRTKEPDEEKRRLIRNKVGYFYQRRDEINYSFDPAIEWRDTYIDNDRLDFPYEIVGLRCDALVESVYTLAGVPIQDVDLYNNPEEYNSLENRGRLLHLLHLGKSGTVVAKVAKS